MSMKNTNRAERYTTYFTGSLDESAFNALVMLRWKAFLLNLAPPHTLSASLPLLMFQFSYSYARIAEPFQINEQSINNFCRLGSEKASKDVENCVQRQVLRTYGVMELRLSL
jgi:hypothetical protein